MRFDLCMCTSPGDQEATRTDFGWSKQTNQKFDPKISVSTPTGGFVYMLYVDFSCEENFDALLGIFLQSLFFFLGISNWFGLGMTIYLDYSWVNNRIG